MVASLTLWKTSPTAPLLAMPLPMQPPKRLPHSPPQDQMCQLNRPRQSFAPEDVGACVWAMDWPTEGGWPGRMPASPCALVPRQSGAPEGARSRRGARRSPPDFQSAPSEEEWIHVLCAATI